MSLSALIFDVDGTLAETEEVHRRAFNEIFHEAGLDWHWSEDDYSRLLLTTGGKERMRAHRDAIGRDEPDDERLAALHIRKTARYGQIVHSGGLALRDGMGELISAAHRAGARLAVATTTSRGNVDALCQACLGKPAHELFEVIAAGDEVTRKKPAPDIYELALQRLDVSPERALAFEDTRNGLLSAKGAGLRVIASPSAYARNEDFREADWLVPDWSVKRLPAIVRALLGQPN